MYRKIFNPTTNRYVNLNSKPGINILSNYINMYLNMNGGATALDLLDVYQDSALDLLDEYEDLSEDEDSDDDECDCVTATGMCVPLDSLPENQKVAAGSKPTKKVRCCGICGAPNVDRKTCPLNTEQKAIEARENGNPAYILKPDSHYTQPKPTSKSKKAQNKSIEDSRVNYIVESINTKNEYGKRLIQKFKETFGVTIDNANNDKCGGNQCHFDFRVQITKDGKKKILRCEEKGTEKTNVIFTKEKPWKHSVQSVNIYLNNTNIGETYCKIFYQFCIGYLKDDLKLTTPNPDYQTFRDQAFFSSGVNKGFTYMLEAKDKYEKKYGPNAPSINKIYSEQMNKLNIEFIQSINQADITEFIKTASHKIKKSLSEKDIWLQTSRLMPEPSFDESSKNSTFLWSSSKDVQVPEIVDIRITLVKYPANIKIEYILADGTIAEQTSLRLRNKFSNFSTDFK